VSSLNAQLDTPGCYSHGSSRCSQMGRIGGTVSDASNLAGHAQTPKNQVVGFGAVLFEGATGSEIDF